MSDESIRKMLNQESSETEDSSEPPILDMGYMSLPLDVQIEAMKSKTCPTCKQMSWDELSAMPTVTDKDLDIDP